MEKTSVKLMEEYQLGTTIIISGLEILYSA